MGRMANTGQRECSAKDRNSCVMFRPMRLYLSVWAVCFFWLCWKHGHFAMLPICRGYCISYICYICTFLLYGRSYWDPIRQRGEHTLPFICTYAICQPNVQCTEWKGKSQAGPQKSSTIESELYKRNSRIRCAIQSALVPITIFSICHQCRRITYEITNFHFHTNRWDSLNDATISINFYIK